MAYSWRGTLQVILIAGSGARNGHRYRITWHDSVIAGTQRKPSAVRALDEDVDAGNVAIGRGGCLRDRDNERLVIGRRDVVAAAYGHAGRCGRRPRDLLGESAAGDRQDRYEG